MDINEIRKWHSIFYPKGGLFEIRLLHGLKNRNWSGYFEDVEVMIKALQPILEQPQYYGNPQAYFTLNEIPEALYSREQHDKFVIGAATTTDTDISRRKFVLLDFDPERAANISSSDEELAKAKHKAGCVYNYLKNHNFHEPVMALSGNGYHLLYKVDMPNDTDHNELIKTFIEALYQIFPGEGVDIDCKVFNAARICKLYGTEARKGTSTEERPWRLSKICYVPKEIVCNDDKLFSDIALSVPRLQPQTYAASTSSNNSDGENFDIDNWLRQHGLEYRIKQNGVFTIYQLRKCPWESSHSSHHDWDSAIFKRNDGQLSFSCWHDHCKGKTWKDVRSFYEPDAYSHQYQPRRTYSYQPKEKKPDIKPESPQLGPMWYEFDEIPDVDLDALEKIETGIKGIDDKIKGLYLSEVSIISGTNSSGKSSFLNTLVLNAIDNGYKCALWSGELRPDILKTWIDMVAAGKQHLSPSIKHPGDWYVNKDIKKAINSWLHGKLVLFNNNYGSKWEQIFSQMQAKREEGFKLFVLDNLMKLDIDILGNSSNEQEKTLVEKLGDFAKIRQVHIILVAHPRKSSGRGFGGYLRKDDIAGSAHISDLADDVFIIHRNNNDFRKGVAEFFGDSLAEEYRTEDTTDKKGKYVSKGSKWNVGNVIEICKNRLYGVMDELVDLYYEPESRRFKNSPNEIKEYGWNKDATTQQARIGFDKQDSSSPFGITDQDGYVPF